MQNSIRFISARNLVILTLGCGAALVLSDPTYNTNFYKYYSTRKDSARNKIAAKFFDQKFPVSAIKTEVLSQKISTSKEWVKSQINKDFATYTDVSKANVIQTYNSLAPENLVVMFNIENGKLTVTRHPQKMNEACEHGLEIYTRIFEYLAKQNYINDVTFLLRLTDYFPNISEQQAQGMAPILTTSKNSAEKIEQNLILIPDYMSLEDIPKLAPRILHANKTYPWRAKQNKILWRGGRADVSGFRKQVVDYSNQHPHSILDAKFIENKKDFVLPEFQLQAKLLLNIDGHTAAWTRPIWQLLSNSVMLKQDSSLDQWYYAAIKPDVHYISVPNNVDELKEIMHKYSDQQLQAIAENGSEFARNNLMLEDMIAYLVETLREYKARQL